MPAVSPCKVSVPYWHYPENIFLGPAYSFDFFILACFKFIYNYNYDPGGRGVLNFGLGRDVQRKAPNMGACRADQW